MQEGNIRTAVVAGAVSIVLALITSFTTIYQTKAAAEASAKSAQTSAAQAQSSSQRAKEAVSAIPGAVATHYSGTKTQANQTTERFDFSTKMYDSEDAVVTGADWHLTIPVDGTYYLGARFKTPYGPDGATLLTPYVTCSLVELQAGSTTEQGLGNAIAFNPACSIAGVYTLNKGDKIYVTFGKAGAADGPVSGEFFSVLIGPRLDKTTE